MTTTNAKTLLEIYAQVGRFPFMVRTLHGELPPDAEPDLIAIPANICLIINSVRTREDGTLAFVTNLHDNRLDETVYTHKIAITPDFAKWELVDVDFVSQIRDRVELRARERDSRKRIRNSIKRIDDKMAELKSLGDVVTNEMDKELRDRDTSGDMTQEEIDRLIGDGSDEPEGGVTAGSFDDDENLLDDDQGADK